MKTKSSIPAIITAAAIASFPQRMRTAGSFGTTVRCFDVDPEPVDPPVKGAKDDKTKKVELTEDELNAKLEAAKADERTRLEKIAAAAKATADEETAKKKGEWETLANANARERDEARAEVKQRDHRDAIKVSIAKAAKAHVGYPIDVFEKYLVPQLTSEIKIDATAGDLDKAVKTAVDTYAGDNPRTPKKGSNGVPSAPKSGRTYLSGGNSGATRVDDDETEPRRNTATAPIFSGATASM